MNKNVLVKMNEVYFTKLKEHVGEKLNMQYQPTTFKIKEMDIKAEIYSYVSIYSIMADYLLQEDESINDAEILKDRMKKDIVSATKQITTLFANCIDERIEKNGYQNLDEFKQALFNEIHNAIVLLKDENVMLKENEM